MRKVRGKINPDEFQFRYSNTNEKEIKCLFGLLYFRGLYHNTKQATRELWYEHFSVRNVYRASVRYAALALSNLVETIKKVVHD